MTQFIQLHLLTAYPPSNLNRDDLGRPKTAIVGGTTRLRISSQSLKRAWRTSELFQEKVANGLGDRTKLFGRDIFLYLIKGGVSFNSALDCAKRISGVFGKNESPIDLKKKKEAEKEKLHLKLQQKWRFWDKEALGIPEYSLKQLNDLLAIEISQLAFIGSEEKANSYKLADLVIEGNELPKSLDVLRKTTKNTDIAMFGRMLADMPGKNIEAAVQVAHAITVNPIKIEDDYFTAVDDLNTHEEDAGAAHIGDAGFASGIFYEYICINRDQLVKNLQGDENLANQAIAALTEAAAKIAPTGKQNSFASRAYTSYLMAEKGTQQPRSLSVAFLKAMRGDDPLKQAI
ncbi:MAG TPA: type I-E CRISPR-associated protein Cas7/Cse4/CasC, partial [Gammaproteobacteria bacterium]|nr:type I-E CRISPR-associated protein Cas7/Cse4/CasC [Gammaproteobacteria bacterium]